MGAWNKKILDRKELKGLYVDEGLSLAKIGKIYECDANVILRNLREFGVNTRNLSEATTKVPVTKEQLIKWYWKDRLSMFEIADRLNCTHSAIVYKFQKFGIESRGHLGLTPPLKLTKEKLEYFYNKGLSLKKIARIYHRSKGGMERRFKDYGIISRGNTNRACKYKKTDFSENLEEKAYMIGFRLGDLNIQPRVSVIQVRCSTTHHAQVKVIRDLFSKYTSPYVWKAKRGTLEIVCLVNRSFDFLIPKEDKIPEWVMEDDSTFWAFFAGYSDAEGCISVSKDSGQQMKRRVGFEISSYDKNILLGLRSKLLQNDISSYFSLSAPKGTRVGKKDYFSKKDAWRLSVQKKQPLWKLVQYWKFFARHREKIVRLQYAENNLKQRNVIKWSRPIDLSIPRINSHPYPFQD